MPLNWLGLFNDYDLISSIHCRIQIPSSSDVQGWHLIRVRLLDLGTECNIRDFIHEVHTLVMNVVDRRWPHKESVISTV